MKSSARLGACNRNGRFLLSAFAQAGVAELADAPDSKLVFCSVHGIALNCLQNKHPSWFVGDLDRESSTAKGPQFPPQTSTTRPAERKTPRAVAARGFLDSGRLRGRPERGPRPRQNPALRFTALLTGTGGASIGVKMRTKQTALTARPLSAAERKARLAALVASGKVSAKAAKLIDFRGPTKRERDFADTLVERGRRALARRSMKAA